jgi:3',5'-cyclic AMP phosphodiesterase CpdA
MSKNKPISINESCPVRPGLQGAGTNCGILCLIVLLSLLTACGHVRTHTAHGQALRAAQITDLHVFDTDPKDGRDENWSSLRSCLLRINKDNASLKKFDFIVVTGDLGVDKQTPGAIAPLARQLANELAASDVKRWLFVPGNNDLPMEEPARTEVFNAFLTSLQSFLPNFHIVNLCADPCVPTSYVKLNDFAVLGFNSGSFKNEAKKGKAEERGPAQLSAIRCLQEQMSNAGPLKIVLFHHEPDIDDPYFVFGEDPTAKRNRTQNRSTLGADNPNSAWTVTPEVRQAWNSVMTDSRIVAAFAGHFHWYDRAIYRNLDWIGKEDALYCPASSRKLHLCPPLSVKRQLPRRPEQMARGYRDLSFDASGHLCSEIVWYQGHGKWVRDPCLHEFPSVHSVKLEKQ